MEDYILIMLFVVYKEYEKSRDSDALERKKIEVEKEAAILRKELYGDESHEPSEDEQNEKRVKRTKGSKSDTLSILSGDDEPTNSKQGSKRGGKSTKNKKSKIKDLSPELVEVDDDPEDANKRVAEIEHENASLRQELLSLRDQLAQMKPMQSQTK